MEWHRITDPNDPLLDHLAARYHLHPLHIEDCRHRRQNAKAEEGEGYLFTVLKPVDVTREDLLRITDLDLFLGADFLITVEEDEHAQVGSLLTQVQAASAGLRADEIFYKLIDGLADSYFPILDHFDDVIDDLEDRVLEKPSPAILSKIFETKRSLIELRRLLVSTRDANVRLQHNDQNLIHRGLSPYIRDVHDHLARHLDMVETQRDLLTGSLDIYLSSLANRTNEVMKVLTVLGTLALPMLAISSFYGMNMRGLPWVNSPHGLAIVSSAMALLTIGLLAMLKYFKWW